MNEGKCAYVNERGGGGVKRNTVSNSRHVIHIQGSTCGARCTSVSTGAVVVMTLRTIVTHYVTSTVSVHS